MIRHLRLLMLCTTLLLGCACMAISAAELPWIVVFYEEGCPDCSQVEELLAGLTSELPPTAIVRYDISDPEALDLLGELVRAYNVDTSSVPVVFVGDAAILGAGRAEEFELRNAIGDCMVLGCESPLKRAPSLAYRSSIIRLTLFAVLFALLLWWQTS